MFQISTSKMFVILMLLHLLADFPLQTIGNPSIANLKCRDWWLDYFKGDKKALEPYKDDYKVMLIIHGFIWSAITFFPMWTTAQALIPMAALLLGNTIIHAYIDNAKANWRCLSLVADQSLHVLQIIMALIVWRCL